MACACSHKAFPSLTHEESPAFVSIESVGVALDVPTGWQRYADGPWTKLRPVDKEARLALVPFADQREATARIGEIAGQLGLGAVAWRGSHNEAIGPDSLPARVGDGACKIGGDTGRVWYATVSAGGASKLLVVYAVNTAAPSADRHGREVDEAVRSLRRR